MEYILLLEKFYMGRRGWVLVVRLMRWGFFGKSVVLVGRRRWILRVELVRGCRLIVFFVVEE